MLTRALIVLVAAACIGGCQLAPKARLVAFDPAEYEPFRAEGTGVVEGQAFLLTQGGAVKVGAGRDVGIHPVTSYSTEGYDRWILGYETLEEGDPQAGAFTRVTTADADGRFRFEALPPGDYYIVCQINWEYANSVYSGGVQTRTTGGIAHARVTVEDGKTTRAVVTRP
jgi:hypothetical protein